MHHANYFYGHAHVLARYCRLDEPMHTPRMRGYYQHGWNIGDGQAPGVPFVAGSRMFVWSERVRRRAWSLGRRNVIVVGAPFAYLAAMEPAGAQPARDGTLFYPFHGWEGQQVRGDHHRMMAELRSVEPGPVTVCLYWHEFRQRRVRAMYERAGFRVISHGYRGYLWRDHAREFLARQLAELRRHRRVVSNRLCSAVWYGLLAGCEAAVYGDPMTIENADQVYGGEARIRSQWPELYGHATDHAVCAELARYELGADRLVDPAELRSYLGWPEPTPERVHA